MSLSIDQCCARTWSLIQRLRIVRTVGTRNYRYLNIDHKVILLFRWLLLSNGDLAGNPRPMEKTSNCFSCCHWNANSILPRNTFPLLTAYNTAQRFDIICVLEIYLSFLFDDKTIEIPGYNLFRANYPNNEKMGGGCLYFKENLCLRQIDILYFLECLLCQINIQNKKGYIVDLCRFVVKFLLNLTILNVILTRFLVMLSS